MNLLPGYDQHSMTIIGQFIRDRIYGSGMKKLVIGISGGLDSAVVLKIAAEMIGPDNVSAFFLPYGHLSEKDRPFAEKAAWSAGVKLNSVDISPVVQAIPLEMEGMVLGNAQARARMVFLYSHANRDRELVLGTSNKTELLLGYFTKYGDGGADIYPIGDLFKTQVVQMASEMGMPEEIIERPPSAGLLDDQTDEGEIGLPYPILDQILMGYLSSLTVEEIVDGIDHTTITVDQMDRSGFSPPITEEAVKGIFQTIARSRHKRWPLAVPKIGGSTVGLDLRERW
ncbi:MAG: NAD(+) synthase [Candidatus Thermoplasmatota archaeon]|nr:NAD(+) synthase [Candidatus Thermoplasmatota archaeon]